MGAGADTARAVTIQADNKIVVAGDNAGDFAIARYMPSGALDTTFDTDGRQTTTFSNSTEVATGVASDSSGRLVVSGYSTIVGKVHFAMARFSSAGALDNTFGASGKTTTSFTTGADSSYALAIQSNGRILLAGGCGATTDFCVSRYLTDGSLDSSWNATGMRTDTMGTAGDNAYALALQSDGKVVLVGDAVVSTQRFVLARYTTPSTQDIVLARYTTNGTLDTTFANAGTYISTLAGSNDAVYALAISSDRKLAVAGIRNGDFYLGRFWSGLEIAADDTYTPLFSRISVLPAAAYSLRKLSWTYAGNGIQVRRSSDNTLQNIAFNTSQNLDTISLLSFCAATSCYVRTWYDQSGNGRDATQTTNGQQPRIVNAGTLDTKNGVPTLVLSGGQNMQSGITVNQLVSGGTDMTVTFVVQQTSQTNSSIISNTTGTDRINVHASWSDGTTYFDVGQCCANSRISAAQNWTTALATGTYRRAGAQMDLWRNGVLGATRSNASGATTATGAIFIGSQDAATTFFTGVFSEVIMFNSGLSTADRTALELDERIYYGTP